MKRQKGFTLIELIVAVAIVGILAAIAFPSYQSSIRKSRRSDAITGLMQVQMAQEKLRANCSSYASAFNASPGGCTGTVASPSSNYYNFSITAGSGTGFTATATPTATGNQNLDTCGTFTINQSGPVYSGTSTASCWGR